ncbi:MAG: hypothetical protein RL186_1047 [Pseudomonadota bacterium]|jgi:hypothetical protein
MGNIANWLSLLTLVFGAGLGLKGLLDPEWARKLVRLQAEFERDEGYGEFRATFGGLFLGLHAVALVMLIGWKSGAGISACVLVSAGWLATAAGRFVAYRKDAGCQHPHLLWSIAIEVAVGLLIAAWPIASLFI